MTLADLSAYEIASMVRSREISAMEALEAALERVAAVDGRPGSIGGDPAAEPEKVHALITLTEARAREQAKRVDEKIAAGEDPGLLAGVPTTVKDIFCVEDTPSTAASKILANFISPYTATPVQRLEAAGAVILGKTNLDEFTYGSSTESSAFQPSTRNPWDPSRVPGGSSGGSAAAVAAGEGALSLGTDTGGSIRQPSSFCGVVGLKPTYGRVSRYGLIAFGSSLDAPGPMARTVKDAAMMLQAIAGEDIHDATAAKVPVPNYLASLEEGIRGMRIGISPDYFKIVHYDAQTGALEEHSVPEVIRKTLLRSAETLAKMGAEIIEDVPMPHTRYGIPVYFVISRVEAASNLLRYDGVKYGYRASAEAAALQDLYRKTRGEGFGVQPKLRTLMGIYVGAAQYNKQYYARALKVRSLIRQDFETIFDPKGGYRLDALLTPTTPTTAFPVGGVYGDSLLMQYADQFTVAANHAGTPGLSLPAGFDEEGLPIGIQLLGADFSEEILFRIGRAFEMATESEPWRAKKPKVL